MIMHYKNGQETKNAIIQGCKALFLTEGYRNVTFKRIGEALDLNPSLITYYFQNKKNLASLVLDDFFQAEFLFLREHVPEVKSPMTMYALQNRIHYSFLASHPSFLAFYKETVDMGLLHPIFEKNPSIVYIYTSFFKTYEIEKIYDSGYYNRMEMGSECEILRHFYPGLEQDETFIRFISSVFPSFIRLSQSIIDEGLEQSKKIMETIDLSQFVF